MPGHSIRSSRDAKQLEARRLMAVGRLRRGESVSAVAYSLGVYPQSVYRWVRQYRDSGAAGLRHKPRSGCPPKLAASQLAQLPALLARGPEAFGFATPVWTADRVAQLIWRRFHVRYVRDHVCRLLRRLGWSWHKHTWLR